MGELAAALQEVTGQNVQVAFVDQGYTGEQPAQAAEQTGLKLEVVKHHEAKRGFVLLPPRWALPPLGSRLRTTVPHLGRLSLVGFCHPHASFSLF